MRLFFPQLIYFRKMNSFYHHLHKSFFPLILASISHLKLSNSRYNPYQLLQLKLMGFLDLQISSYPFQDWT